MQKYYLYLFLGLVVFTNCRKDKNKLVDPGLEVFVDRFFAEAAMRNVEVSDNNLEVVFKDLTAEGVCGLGYFSFGGKDMRRVEISNNLFCWDIQSEFGRESLVFHELGHAILRKVHRNRKLPNGLPADLMCDGNVCDIFSFYDQYTLGKRAYYLDELFNAAAPNPDWGKIKTKETVFFEEDMEDRMMVGQFELTDSSFLNNFSRKVLFNPASQSKRLQLTAQSILNTPASANWIYRLNNPVIPEGVDLKLSAKISTENMQGEGIVLAIRTISGNNETTEVSAAISSRNVLEITGNTAEKTFDLILPYCPSDLQQIELIFQIAPNTSGIVNLDDVKLSIME